MFKLEKKLSNGVRIGKLSTPHGEIETPFFMPVGTAGSVKATAPWELEDMGAQIILSNTYHLYLRPGEQLVKELGGLHKFMGWNKPILTDSGGYQVFSLGREKKFSFSNFQFPFNDQLSNGQINEKCKMRNDNSNSLVRIRDDGVEFKSHLDGSKHLFTPEKVIDIQLDLGVDILMPLDVCPSGKASREEIEEAVRLTIAWARRSKIHFDRQVSNINGQLSVKFKNSKIQKLNDNCNLKLDHCNGQRPLLHGIVQGGLDPELRKYCAEELIKLDFDGYSVGGLAVDLETRDMWNIVKQMGEILPEDKQRYLMGVGTPDDIITATKLGMDMFDCVLPTRLARHANVFVSRQSSVVSGKGDKLPTTNYQLLNLLNSKFKNDGGVIDENCGCEGCERGLSKAYISHLLRSNEILGLRLTTLHNLWQYLQLMRQLRDGKEL